MEVGFALVVVGFVFFIWLLINYGQEKEQVFKPLTGTLESFLVDPDTKLLNVYASVDAVFQGTIDGKATYQEKPDKLSFVRLQRSGSGFRVWGHPDLPPGKWLPCR